MIRKYQPDIVLANAPNDRHPDHGRASLLVRDSCFLSGLVKIETEHDGLKQQPWRPKRVFNYIQDLYLEPHFIIDISDVFDVKMESVKAYGSQFFSLAMDGPETYISTSEFLNMLEYRCRLLGKKIGVKYGEGFLLSNTYLGMKDFSNIILPDLV